MKLEYQIVYWRDIPAQIKVRSGRERLGRELPERFQKAIDWAAMASNATSTDAYLEEWRMSSWKSPEDELPETELPEAAEHIIQQIDGEYSAERLYEIMTNKGFRP
jgi:Virulence factor